MCSKETVLLKRLVTFASVLKLFTFEKGAKNLLNFAKMLAFAKSTLSSESFYKKTETILMTIRVPEPPTHK